MGEVGQDGGMNEKRKGPRAGPQRMLVHTHWTFRPDSFIFHIVSETMA